MNNNCNCGWVGLFNLFNNSCGCSRAGNNGGICCGNARRGNGCDDECESALSILNNLSSSCGCNSSSTFSNCGCNRCR